MPKQLSKSEVLQMRLKGLKADDGADLELDEEDEAVLPDAVVGVLADLGRQMEKMTAALTDLNRIVGQSLVSLADIVEAQSRSIDALAAGLSNISKAAPAAQKPRACVFDVQRENGRISSVTMKEK